MKPWRIIRWRHLAILYVLVFIGFTFLVWRVQKTSGACHDSDSYLCKLISATNLPTDYLVITGILGVFAAVFTLKSIHHQAVQMRKQTKISEQNIHLFISKERARLAVDFKPLKLKTRAVPDKSVRSVEFTVSIYGATAATILDSGVTSGIFIKGQEKEPDLGSAVMFPMTGLPTLILPNTPSLELETFLFIVETQEDMILEDIQKELMIAAVRGFIRYRDVFDVTRTIRFRYYWGPSYEIPGLVWSDTSYGQWIKCGPPEDNQENPN